MRLLCAFDEDPGGAASIDPAADALLASLAWAGHEILLVTGAAKAGEAVVEVAPPPGKDAGGKTSSYRRIGLPMPARWMLPGDTLRLLGRTSEWTGLVAKAIGEFKPHRVVVHGFCAMTATMAAARPKNIASTVWWHETPDWPPDLWRRRHPCGSSADPVPPAGDKRLGGWLAGWSQKILDLIGLAVKAADRVVVDHNDLAAYVLAHFGRSASAMYPVLGLPGDVAAGTLSAGPVVVPEPFTVEGCRRLAEVAGLLPDRRFRVVRGLSRPCQPSRALTKARKAFAGMDMLELFNAAPPAAPWSWTVGGACLWVADPWPDVFLRETVVAALHGLPALVVEAAGMAETVGLGGVRLPSASLAAAWAAGLRQLTAPDYHQALSAEARRHAAMVTATVTTERMVDAVIG